MKYLSNLSKLFAVLFCLFLQTHAMAQEISIKGKITDQETKEALIDLLNRLENNSAMFNLK